MNALWLPWNLAYISLYEGVQLRITRARNALRAAR